MSLDIVQLEAHGLSRRVTDIWRQSGFDKLLPLQEQAVTRSGVLQDRSLLVFAPTSSGKTFIAEMAALKQLQANHRVIYLVPTKALAEEKFRRFENLYKPLGYSILAATRERPESDAPALKGRFDVLIAVYEKLKSYLVQSPTLLSRAGLVVSDEIQMLGQPERGGVVDLLLTKVATSPYPVQFLGLSAVLGDVLRIAQWLGCDFIQEARRPVDLHEGVLNMQDGKFYYRAFNTGEEGIEQLLPGPPGLDTSEREDYIQAVAVLAEHLTKTRNEQVLIFVPTRSASRRLAENLSSYIELDAAERAVAELEKYEESHARSSLLHCFQKGVAFHNADLSHGLRKLIESQYNAGNIRLLISTSTLGEGVNLSGKNVIQVPEMVRQDEWTGRFNFVPLSRARFKNQGGRAGRLGREQDFGRSVIIGYGEEQVERLTREYLHGELEPLRPPLQEKQLPTIILDLISSGVCHSREDIYTFLLRTYTGLITWGASEKELQNQLGQVISGCLDSHFLMQDSEGNLTTTGIGDVTAITGIKTGTANLFHRWLSELGKDVPGCFECLLAAAFTPDADDFSLPVSRREKRNMDFSVCVGERINSEVFASRPLLQKLVNRPGGYTDVDFSALKKVLVLSEWIGPMDTLAIEDQFGILAGIIHRLAEHFSWLIQACISLADALNLSREIADALWRLNLRLRLGMEEEGIGLAGLHVEGLERSHLQALVHEGFDSPAALRDADAERLSDLLPAGVLESLFRELSRTDTPVKEEKVPVEKQEDETKSKTPSERKDKPDSFLVFKLSEPGMVTCAGKRIHLTPLPYQLLLTLARRPGQLVTYITIDEEVWPEQKVERQQVSFHRATITKALAGAGGKEKAGALIKTYSGQGLLLNLKPEDINILP